MDVSDLPGFRNLKVYQQAYVLALEVFELSRKFPHEERYSLTSQVRRSSRSVCSNVAEAYRKRRYPAHFQSKLSDADAELAETLVWLDFATDLEYLSAQRHKTLTDRYVAVGRMLGAMIDHPEKFVPKRGAKPSSDRRAE